MDWAFLLDWLKEFINEVSSTALLLVLAKNTSPAWGGFTQRLAWPRPAVAVSARDWLRAKFWDNTSFRWKTALVASLALVGYGAWGLCADDPARYAVADVMVAGLVLVAYAMLVILALAALWKLSRWAVRRLVA